MNLCRRLARALDTAVAAFLEEAWPMPQPPDVAWAQALAEKEAEEEVWEPGALIQSSTATPRAGQRTAVEHPAGAPSSHGDVEPQQALTRTDLNEAAYAIRRYADGRLSAPVGDCWRALATKFQTAADATK